MLHLITCYGRIMPRLAELLFMLAAHIKRKFISSYFCPGWHVDDSQKIYKNNKIDPMV